METVRKETQLPEDYLLRLKVHEKFDARDGICPNGGCFWTLKGIFPQALCRMHYLDNSAHGKCLKSVIDRNLPIAG
ncbi:hypothetical protein A2701_04560 [Candidatus Amesbacteria bacterium RIFCSPHIGHO2_01_FULL_47_34]|uniref:Uncharacterized protein n=2 Tax=Candidatus Amesiibacteriota TaxID=1752730 RepID=A0A1F4ZZN9_9BACT|nr:MAG: hypothetical protein A2972_01950 [Candidatus Amesbacteria bacterium RIFCSPLOWO2_01_FULL_47_33]OGD00604.1 MAG: hypothetical protein A2701_04560 [Candidatus Amesbacteria bacterium RIFCSPHIGHO2_01_FULL_47_34]OGD10934.1 MAG: hypothetical protein A2395_00390 [Candidatus Amesbacteria bacterium RIFOXYB1_FULL_47_9]